MDDADRNRHLAHLAEHGYAIVENAIEPDLLQALNAALARLERELDAKPAQNGFEGRRTVRIYNLLAHGAPFDRVPVHPSVLPLIEGVLDDGCLVSPPPTARPGWSRTPTASPVRSTAEATRPSPPKCRKARC